MYMPAKPAPTMTTSTPLSTWSPLCGVVSIIGQRCMTVLVVIATIAVAVRQAVNTFESKTSPFCRPARSDVVDTVEDLDPVQIEAVEGEGGCGRQCPRSDSESPMLRAYPVP